MNKTTSLALRDFLLFACLFALVTIYANWMFFTGDESLAAFIPPFNPQHNRSMQTHLGYEYLNLANAVYEGRGFSDPFEDSTGPSSWAPPLLVYLMAAVLCLTEGSVESLATVFFGGQILVLALVATIALSAGRNLGNPWASLLSIAIVMTVNFKWLFQITHDSVFQMFWVSLTVAGLWYWKTPPDRVGFTIGWGIIGGWAALAGPAAGFAWAVGTTLVWGLKQWKSVLIAAATSMFVVAPWVTYQYQRLGKFMPIKSNSAFELYQSQVVLPDGLIFEEVFRLHPASANSEEGQRYREIGEIAYLEEKKIQGWNAIVADPNSYIRKTTNRLLAASVWLNCETKVEKEATLFGVARFFAIFPFLGLLALAYRVPHYKPWVLPAIVCYAAYLMPYVLVSYYERYGVAVTLPRILLTTWFLIVVKERFCNGLVVKDISSGK
jgi:hypothetical protein